MTEPSALLDAMQARVDAAPPKPWRYREAAFGDPANGPDHTVLEALHPEQGWSSIARGDYDAWSGYGLGFAAAARSDMPRLIAAVRAVLTLAEEWRYKGEYGDGPWQLGEGPDQEGLALDEASSQLHAAIRSALIGDDDE